MKLLKIIVSEKAMYSPNKQHLLLLVLLLFLLFLPIMFQLLSATSFKLFNVVTISLVQLITILPTFVLFHFYDHLLTTMAHINAAFSKIAFLLNSFN